MDDPKVTDQAVWQAARNFVDRFGEEAPVQAAIRATELAEEGDLEAAGTWRRIEVAARTLLETVPPSGMTH